MIYFIKSNFRLGDSMYLTFKKGVINNSFLLRKTFCPLSISPLHIVAVSIAQAEYTGDIMSSRIMTIKNVFILTVNIF